MALFQEQAEGLSRFVKKLNGALETVNIYLGRSEEITVICTGARAPAAGSRTATLQRRSPGGLTYVIGRAGQGSANFSNREQCDRERQIDNKNTSRGKEPEGACRQSGV